MLRDDIKRMLPAVAFGFPDEASAASGVPATRLREAKAAGEIAVCVFAGGEERERCVVLADDLVAFLRRLRRPARAEKGE